MDRRSFFKGLAALAASPALACVAKLIPVKSIVPARYRNRTIRVWMDVESIRDRNVLLRADPYMDPPVYSYREIPIRVIG